MTTEQGKLAAKLNAWTVQYAEFLDASFHKREAQRFVKVTIDTTAQHALEIEQSRRIQKNIKAGRGMAEPPIRLLTERIVCMSQSY